MRFLMILIIEFVTRVLHLVCGVGSCCKFVPSCSGYLIVAIDRHGFWAGFSKWFVRFIQCQNWFSVKRHGS